MNKKFSVIFILSAFLISISFLFGCVKKSAFAYDSTIDIEYQSKSCLLLEPNTNTVLYAKNENEKRPIASMCKIMTLLIVFDEIKEGNLSFDTDIPVTDNASHMGGSQVFLESNASYRADELIKSIVVASANDSCVALAEYVSGSEQVFVNKMNEKCKELGMEDTVFVNCTGLPKPGQYSTAKDVSIMFSSLIKHQDYFNFSNIWMDEINHPKGRITEISNTNKLIKFYDGCDGGKTGYTSEAGHCLCATAIRGGMRLVSVVISSPDSKTRFKEISSMFNYGFANYVNKLVIDKNNPLELSVNVIDGKKDCAIAYPEKSFYLLSKKNQERALDIDFIPLNNVKAPVKVGDIVGEIAIYENSIKIASINAISNEEILEATYFDYVKNIINNWCII